MIRHVGITRDFRPDGELEEFCRANNIRLSHHNFLKVQVLPFRIPKEADLVFFSSSNAVKSYFETEEPRILPFACFGSSTAKALESYGHRAAFIGSSGNSSIVAEAFARFAENRTVFFPLSSLSKKVIPHSISEQNRICLTTYEVSIVPIEIDALPEIMIFTSPSNVDGFQASNSDTMIQSIAIGNTTQEHLKKQGFRNNLTAPEPSDNGLISALKQLL